jgi:hypothetical protein
MHRLLVGLLVVTPAIALTACSSGRKAYIPVDSALRTWQPPEADTDAPAPPAAPPAPAPSAAKEAKKK